VALQGWAELLAWMHDRIAEGKLSPDLAWQHFRELAATSKHPAIGELVVRFRAAPAKDRVALVGTIASILAPVEWPPAWDEARRQLVAALGGLLLAMDDGFGDLGQDDEIFRAGISTLSVARDLLRAPCRRDELRAVARLCDLGNAWCWRAAGRALERVGARAADEPVREANRRRALIAYATYAQAARTMNDMCGATVFAGLELEPPHRGTA
jgi:hypothetical protein